jgi:ribosome biogenesis protein Nip4
MSEGTPKNAGVIVFNSNTQPIALGIAIHTSALRRNALPTVMVIAGQGDLWEYLRDEALI